jgi:hypothetical protein
MDWRSSTAMMLNFHPNRERFQAGESAATYFAAVLKTYAAYRGKIRVSR